MLSGESKHRPNDSNMSQGYSERYRGLKVREELQGWGGGFSVPQNKITNGWMPNQPLPLNDFHVKIRNNPKTYE